MIPSFISSLLPRYPFFFPLPSLSSTHHYNDNGSACFFESSRYDVCTPVRPRLKKGKEKEREEKDRGDPRATLDLYTLQAEKRK